MLPLAISLVRSGFRADTTAMIGWFGPRGLASVVFTILAYETLHQAGVPVDDLVQIATWTVLLSIMAHGLSAVPLARLYGRRMVSAPSDLPEKREVSRASDQAAGVPLTLAVERRLWVRRGRGALDEQGAQTSDALKKAQAARRSARSSAPRPMAGAGGYVSSGPAPSLAFNGRTVMAWR